MKFTSSILPFFATVLPVLLVQHATPANAAALCIPGIYCPQAPPSPPPACTCTEGGTPSHTSTSESTYTSPYVPQSPSSSTWGPETTTTTTVIESPPTTTPVVSVESTSSTTTSAPKYTSEPAGSSPGGGQYTATTTITVTGAPQPTGSSCSTGPVQCCDSIQPSSSKGATQLMGLLGIVLQGANVPIGLNCIPIDVLGLGSAGNCNAQAVCCENNDFQGLINIGCSPINIGL